MELLIKSASNPLALADVVRREVYAIDKTPFVSGFTTMEQRVGRSLFERRFQTSLLSAFSLVALLLAAVGDVCSRAFFRAAAGAGDWDSDGAGSSEARRALNACQGLKMVFAGVILGIVLVFTMTRLMERLLYEIKPTDPSMFAAVSFLLLGIAAFACWLPARRAAKVDPMQALRCV
jgi:hypothetical protein